MYIMAQCEKKKSINVRMTIALLILLVVRKGAESKVSSVTFADRDLCAVPGSSVALRCSYDYPDGHTVHAVSWSKGVLTNGQWTRVKLSHLPALQNRSDYLGDLQHDCGLALSELEESDSGYYYFRFDTDTIGWRSRTSVYLAVTGVNAGVHPSHVESGSTVTLECSTSCLNPRVVWFKDGELLSQSEFQARPQDSGNYSCALEGQEWSRSKPVPLNVQYPPANVSISMHHPNGSTGGAVNLTCTSDSNPAAENYTWYRKTNSAGLMLQVGSGQLLSLASVEGSHSGLYLCQARNQLGEANSTKLLQAAEDKTDSGNLILLICSGVKVVIILTLMLVLIWTCFQRRRRRNSSLEVKEEIRPHNDYVYDSIS